MGIKMVDKNINKNISIIKMVYKNKNIKVIDKSMTKNKKEVIKNGK